LASNILVFGNVTAENHQKKRYSCWFGVTETIKLDFNALYSELQSRCTTLYKITRVIFLAILVKVVQCFQLVQAGEKSERNAIKLLRPGIYWWLYVCSERAVI